MSVLGASRRDYHRALDKALSFADATTCLLFVEDPPKKRTTKICVRRYIYMCFCFLP